MFAQRNFIACIEGQLAERGFGAKRKAEIVDNFNGLTKQFEAQGYGSQVAGTMAMNAVFDKLAMLTKERAKRAAKTLEVQAENVARVTAGGKVNASVFVMDGGSGHGAGLVRGAISAIQTDPRLPGFLSAESIRNSYRGKYHALIADGLDAYGKGAFSTQRNVAGLSDIPREIFGQDTGNAAAKAFAKSYLALDDVMIADRNNAGGSIQKLDKYFLPQKQNAVTVMNTPFEKWRDDHMAWLDWNKMAWPDGSPIKPSEREGILKDVYTTFRTDGANKIDPASFSGRGSAVGNQLEDHRFLVYKDAESWMAAHEAYGDGNIADVVIRHIEQMAHKTALIDVMGPNPEMWFDNIKAVVLKQAADIAASPGAKGYDKKAVSEATKVIKNKLEPMFEQYTHKNPMDPNSPFGAGVTATANVLTGAKLGGVVALAAPGDFQQTLAIRWLNKLPLLSGMDDYFKGVSVGFKEAQGLGTRSGYVFDNLVGATYTTERFSPIATYGPHWSRTLSDSMIRASGLARHTEIARWVAQKELMGVMNDMKGKEFNELPFALMMQRYGIGKPEWDAVRNEIKTWSPQAGADFLRPLDILETKLANKQELYQRFYSMVDQESRHMVPGATLEAAITMRGTSRPDTLPGMILHSFSMYKNFPMTVVHMYGRLAMSQAENRLSFIAAMGVGMTLVGAAGVQLRELSKGRTLEPMNTATFWGQAALSGGAMSIWGDFLFGGVNDQFRNAANIIGGPLAGLAADTANLALGDPFKYVNLWDNERDEHFKSTFTSRAANFLRLNTPGTSLIWARLALEREIWDTLDNLVDPRIDAKRRQRMRKQERTYGNTYWSEPGSALFGR